MKLAEALQERADLNRRIEQLNIRLINNATVQEGEQPSENPEELFAQLNSCIEKLELLISKINLTNCEAATNGQSITQLIAKKDCLILKLKVYRNFTSESSQIATRATRSEIKILSTANVKEMQKTVDEMAKELRIVDNRIQELNWKIDIKE